VYQVELLGFPFVKLYTEFLALRICHFFWISLAQFIRRSFDDSSDSRIQDIHSLGEVWAKKVSYMMRNLNADGAGMDVHLSSMAPTSMNRAYHKIRGAVKKGGPTAIFWVWGRSVGNGKSDHI